MSAKTKELIRRFKTDEIFRGKIMLYYGATLNLGFALMQLYGGIRYQSAWFAAFGIYYAVISGVRYYLGYSLGKKGKKGWKCFQTVGFVVAIMNLALVVMISIMIANPEIAIHEYSMVITVVTGVWTLVSAIITIVSWVKMRGKDMPVELASKQVDVVTSIVSVLMFQTSMIASTTTLKIIDGFSLLDKISALPHVPKALVDDLNGILQALINSNRITGAIVAIFATVLTIYMIIRGTVESKNRGQGDKH